MAEPLGTPPSVQPFVLAALLCDLIITEAGTNKKTLVGLFDKVFAPGYPAPQRFGIYVKLTDAQGAYRLRLDYVKRDGEQVLHSGEVGTVQVDDRLGAVDVAFSITAAIPEAGLYEFRLYANDSFLTHVDFSAEILPLTEGLPS